jgi:transcription antitermination protein NusB
MSTRREARERVMQALYALKMSGDDVDHVLANLVRPFLSEDVASLRFAEQLLLRTLDHSEEVDRLIERHTRNWELERVAVLDRLLLRMSTVEFLYFEDIPPKVSINEAIEVAKKFSTPRSGQFINGVLDAVLKELREEGRIEKTGRGLIDFDTGEGSSRSSKRQRPTN